ncbi:protein of unknown function [Bacillus velezensis UCMB5033]|nr:protein of unknown function [Bacillus velezensis UCMB5033]
MLTVRGHLSDAALDQEAHSVFVICFIIHHLFASYAGMTSPRENKPIFFTRPCIPW